MLIIVAVLFAIVGVAIGITYFVQKKNGVLNSYEAFSDIMTEDEFERWQKRKNKITNFQFVAPLRTASAVLYFCIAWLYSFFSDGLVDISL